MVVSRVLCPLVGPCTIQILLNSAAVCLYDYLAQSSDTKWWLQVVAALNEEEDLPWEGEMKEELTRKLGAMREPILAMLHRDPAMRPSMNDVHTFILNMEHT